MRPRTVLTPTDTSIAPRVGDLMAGPKAGGPCYRIVGVTVLRQAGGAQTQRYRLSCMLCARAEAAGDEVDPRRVHPWRLCETQPRPVRRDAIEPPPVTSPLLERMGIRDRWMMERIQFSAPLLFALGLEAITRSKAATDHAQQARAARVGRNRGGRETEFEIEEDARDPGSPNQRIRRARRADPLHTLFKHRSITGRHFDAAEALRSDIENGMPALGGASQSEVHAAPWDRARISDRQIAACASVREAVAHVPRRERLVLAWMIGGGTISGFTAFARVHNQTAADGLKNALDVVADFYLGAER